MLARSTSAHIFSLLPCFGPQDIAAITREDVKKGAYGLLDQGRSRSTVKAALVPLCEMFTHALEDGYVTKGVTKDRR